MSSLFGGGTTVVQAPAPHRPAAPLELKALLPAKYPPDCAVSAVENKLRQSCIFWKRGRFLASLSTLMKQASDAPFSAWLAHLRAITSPAADAAVSSPIWHGRRGASACPDCARAATPTIKRTFVLRLLASELRISNQNS